MSLRFNAISSIAKDAETTIPQFSSKITAIFGENVFTQKTAREFLSDEAYKSLITSIRGGKKIDRGVASQIANGIRAWHGLKVKVLHTIHTGFNH
jgi:glutamine synthetase